MTTRHHAQENRCHLSALAFAAALALNGAHAVAQAQTQTAAALPPVLVTAKPIVEDVVIDPFASSSAVVGEAQLRDQNAVDLAGALRRTPGVQIARQNPVGAFGGDQGGAVFIRGLGVSRPGSEIKTYIDGVPFYMGVWNHPLLDLLPVNGMQAITVHKGPAPQLYGNNLAAISLQTKTAKVDGLQGNGRLSAGSFGTVVEQADLLGRFGAVDFMLAQGYAKSDGHRAHAEGELKNIMGKVGLQLAPQWRVGASFLYLDNKASDPGTTSAPSSANAPQYNTQGGMVTAFVSHAHADWRGEFRLYSNQGDGDWVNQAAPDGDTLTSFKLSGLRWKEEGTPWKGGRVVVGLDHDRIGGDVRFNRVAPAPQSTFDAPTFKVTSPYVAVSQTVAIGGNWSVVPSAGVRFYDHNLLASKTAPHLGLSLESPGLTVFMNAARGVNYPGLEAPVLASLIPPLADSWKRLSAEEMDHLEIGVKASPTASTQIDASVFEDRIKNRYVFAFPPHVAPPPQFINLGAYKMRGVELSARQSFGGDWNVFAGLTWLDPSIDGLPYTPKRAFTVGINGRLGPVRLALDAQQQSDFFALTRARAAGATNTDRLDGFTVANLRLSLPVAALGKKGEVFVAVENLFDRDYAYRVGYPMPGRSAQVGLSASF
jgi:outer membrane receptor protein involved in Fe transport